jgi:hypothetical protein
MEQANLNPPSDTSQFFRVLAGFAVAVLVALALAAPPTGWLPPAVGWPTFSAIACPQASAR